jgi:hypothetical protein
MSDRAAAARAAAAACSRVAPSRTASAARMTAKPSMIAAVPESSTSTRARRRISSRPCSAAWKVPLSREDRVMTRSCSACSASRS